MSAVEAQLEQLQQLLDRVNDSAIGRAGDDLKYHASFAEPGSADVHCRHGGAWVARVPGSAATLQVLEALSTAVRFGELRGRIDGKREIGQFLRDECGL